MKSFLSPSLNEKEFYPNWGCVKKLKQLNLRNSSLSTQDAQRILNSCPQLKTLSFRDGNQLDPNMLIWNAVKGLKKLDLRNTLNITSTTLNKLGSACPDITTLKMNNVSLDANFEWSKFPKLTKLYVNTNGEGTIAISSFKNLLENCPLENFLFGGELSGELTNLSKGLLLLKYLDFEGSNITDPTLVTILNNSPNLKILNINVCDKLTDVLEQVDLKKLAKLEVLYAYRYLGNVDDAAVPVEIATKSPLLRMVAFGPNDQGLQSTYKGIDSVKEMRRFLQDPD